MSQIRKQNIKSNKESLESLNSEALFEQLIKGNPAALGKAITWVESSNLEIRKKGLELLTFCENQESDSIRLGITGVPGVGKSTFIESLGELLIEKYGFKVAVLAIDPSSKKSGGSILGDKTRMENLAKNEKAFIRPSASGRALGGVTVASKESVSLCEAAGFDVIIIETVGVGQSETAVSEMVDFFLLLMLSGAGDELQGIKRGIMEMADALIINKADGDNVSLSKRAMGEYKSALHLFPPNQNGWIPHVGMCSGLNNEGVEEVWKVVSKFKEHNILKGFWSEKRRFQDAEWLEKAMIDDIIRSMESDRGYLQKLEALKLNINQGDIKVYRAFKELLSAKKKD